MNNKLKLLLALLTVSTSLGIAAACGGDETPPASSSPSSSSSEPAELAKYTVKFLDYDDAILSEEEYEEGATIEKPADPTRDGDSDYVYEFTGWDKEVSDTATADVTYKATYKKVAIEYTVTFKVDGEQFGEVLTYSADNMAIVEPVAPEKAGYTVVWTSYTLGGQNIEVNAVYTLIQYSIVFKDGDTVVATVNYNVTDFEDKVPPATPYHAGYDCSWGAFDFTKLENQEVELNKEIITYTVYFVHPKTGMQLAAPIEFTVETIDDVVFPAIPEDFVTQMAGYEIAWSTKAEDLTLEDTTVTPVATPIEYNVVFKNGEDVVDTVVFTVNGAEKDAPAVPEKTGYTGAWETYSFENFVNQEVNPVYTANTYTITYDAKGGTASTTSQDVTFDDTYTLATATSSKLYQEFVGWVDEDGNMFVAGEVWDIARDVTLTAKYDLGSSFETLTEVPSYLSAASHTASLSIVELNGNKVLKMQGGEGRKNHGLNVTIDFLHAIFADPTVSHLAFDVKSETTQHTNFRRSTIRTTGSVGSWGQEPYEADVQADNTQVMGYRADAFKTFFFSRKDYQNWVDNNVAMDMLISAGNFAEGESLYVDNIRPVTQVEYKKANFSFETGGLRPNGGNLLAYAAAYGSTWQWAITADTVEGIGRPTFTDFGYTNENVTDGNRAIKFTKTAGMFTFRFNSKDVQSYKDLIAETGYWAFDLFIPEDAGDITVEYASALGLTNSVIHGSDLIKGRWMTVYGVVDSNMGVRLSDTNGGTYMIDNLRSVSRNEYLYSFEANTGGLRTNLLNDDTANSGAFYWYNRGADYSGVRASLSVAEGNGEGDVNAISNVRMDTEIAHSGNYSIAFDKGSGYVSFSRHANSQALVDMANGFTFWIYSTVEIDGVNSIALVNGVNNKFNGGEGIIIPANTWTQITVEAEDIGNGRFLILQGKWEGSIYLDDFMPLPVEAE